MKLKNTNKKYTQIAVYVVVTAVVVYCLSRIADSMPVIWNGLIQKLSWLVKVIQPVILGFILAYLVEPLVTFFQRQYGRIKFLRNKEKRSRGLAIVTVLLIILAGLGTLISLLVYSITDQLRLASFDDIIALANQYISVVDDFSATIRDKLAQLNIESVELSQYVKQAGAILLNFVQGFAKGVAGSVSNISGVMTNLVFGLIIAIYFLIDGKLIIDYMTKVSKALLSGKVHTKIKSFIDKADMVFSGYIRGQLMDALIMMILISVVLSLIGVKFGILIGVLAGIGNLIPYFGPFVAYGSTILVCLLNGQYRQLFLAVVLLFIIQTLDGNVIGPKLLSKSINIHPLLVIISLIFGSAIGGLMGMLLAVPVGAFLKVLFVEFIDNRLAARVTIPDVPEPSEPFEEESHADS